MNHLEITEEWRAWKYSLYRRDTIRNEKACGCFDVKCGNPIWDDLIGTKICPNCTTECSLITFTGSQDEFLVYVHSRPFNLTRKPYIVWDEWTCGCVKLFGIGESQMVMYRCPECRSHDPEIQARYKQELQTPSETKESQTPLESKQALQEWYEKEIETPFGVPLTEIQARYKQELQTPWGEIVQTHAS
jgi:hypothetical protein